MRRISPGTVTVGVFAILLGLVAAYVARRSFESKPPQEVVKKQPTVQMVVAQRNIKEYYIIRQDDVAVIDVPKERVPEGALRNPAIAVGRGTKNPIRAGDPILESQLHRIGATPDYGDQLPPGYRAVTIAVTGTSSSRRFIKPGSYVDITLIVQGKHPGFGYTIDGSAGGWGTKVLMRSIKVLRVGEERVGLQQSNNRAASLTVAVNPEQAKRLALAERVGTLSVSLVSAHEVVTASPINDEEDLMINSDDLLGLTFPSVPQPYTVEIYKNGQRSVLQLGPHLHQEAMEATEADNRRRTRQGSGALRPASGLEPQQFPKPTLQPPSSPSAPSRRSILPPLPNTDEVAVRQATPQTTAAPIAAQPQRYAPQPQYDPSRNYRQSTPVYRPDPPNRYVAPPSPVQEPVRAPNPIARSVIPPGSRPAPPGPSDFAHRRFIMPRASSSYEADNNQRQSKAESNRKTPGPIARPQRPRIVSSAITQPASQGRVRGKDAVATDPHRSGRYRNKTWNEVPPIKQIGSPKTTSAKQPAANRAADTQRVPKRRFVSIRPFNNETNQRKAAPSPQPVAEQAKTVETPAPRVSSRVPRTRGFVVAKSYVNDQDPSANFRQTRSSVKRGGLSVITNEFGKPANETDAARVAFRGTKRAENKVLIDSISPIRDGSVRVLKAGNGNTADKRGLKGVIAPKVTKALRNNNSDKTEAKSALQPPKNIRSAGQPKAKPALRQADRQPSEVKPATVTKVTRIDSKPADRQSQIQRRRTDSGAVAETAKRKSDSKFRSTTYRRPEKSKSPSSDEKPPLRTASVAPSILSGTD